MCYSAMVNQKYRDFVRQFDADISIDAFVALYVERASNPAVKIPKAMDANFSDPQTEPERQIRELITAQNRSQSEKWQQELFKQRTRLADAERSLQVKVTKKAESDQRIATEKVEWLLGKLADLNRIRREHRSMWRMSSLQFHHVDHDDGAGHHDHRVGHHHHGGERRADHVDGEPDHHRGAERWPDHDGGG